MKSKLLLAIFAVLNLTVSERVFAQANSENKPLDINRTPQSQIIKDFNRLLEQEVELLQIDRTDILNIPRDYESLKPNVDLFRNNLQSKDKAKNSTIYDLDQDSRIIFEQNHNWNSTIENQK